MLTLSLTLTPSATIAVQVDGAPSHSFPLQALALNEQDLAKPLSCATTLKTTPTFLYCLLLTVFSDPDGALRLYQESLAIAERLGDLRGKAATLAMLGQVYSVRGEPETALRALLPPQQILSHI